MDIKRNNILIVDDDESIRDTLEAVLNREYNVFKALDGHSGLRILGEQEIDLVLLDILLPDMNGLEILKQIKDRFNDVQVIMISMVKEVETAVQAMKLGAFHYITKGFDYDEILFLVDKALKSRKDDREILYLKGEMDPLIEKEFIIGQSSRMQEVHKLVNKVAPLSSTILLLGESGTGKQLLARYIHRLSGWCDKPFVTVDLGAVPETLMESILFGHEKGAFSGAYKQHIGKFELADGGTLFLDEVANLRLELQSKLLRAIQEGEFERVGGSKTIRFKGRLITATNIDLNEAVRKGNFREDLFYRLNVIPINLPPLRERLMDIPLLVEFFVQRYNVRLKKQIKRVDQSVQEALCSYDWPGNVRELENMMERLVALSMGDTIHFENLPIEYRLTVSKEKEDENAFNKAMDAFQQNFIIKVFEREGWNLVATAKALGIPLSTLKYKIKKLELSKFFPYKDR